jgi:ABC-type polysaccharide/polyol phosphate export permease
LTWSDSPAPDETSKARPTNLVERVRRPLELIWVLAVSDLQVRYGRGGLRAVKWFLEPYAAVGVYLILIALVLSTGTESAGLSLACAVVPFQLVATTFGNALSSVTQRSSIIVNTSFPRIVLPLSSLATESIAWLASLTLLPLMMAVYLIAPTAAILWLPVVVAITAIFAAALAYPAALIGAWYPEYGVLVGSLVRTLFFLSPGLVALEQISGTARELMPFNPFTGLFEAFRDTLLFGESPAAWELLAPLAAAAIVLAVALPIYRREQAHLAKLVG